MNYKLLSIHWYDDASEELLTFNGLRHFSYSESSLFSKLYASIEIGRQYLYRRYSKISWSLLLFTR